MELLYLLTFKMVHSVFLRLVFERVHLVILGTFGDFEGTKCNEHLFMIHLVL